MDKLYLIMKTSKLNLCLIKFVFKLFNPYYGNTSSQVTQLQAYVAKQVISHWDFELAILKAFLVAASKGDESLMILRDHRLETPSRI